MEFTKEAYAAIAAIVDDRVREIRVHREEFDELRSVVRELALRVDQLTQRVDDLAQAQARTEQALTVLIQAVTDLRRQVGVVTDRFGFTLEELAADRLPRYFKAKEGWTVDTPTAREYRTNGQTIEMDLVAEARRGKRRGLLVGSVKSRIAAGEVRDFANRVEAIPELQGILLLPVLCGLLIDPAAAEEGRRRKVRVLYLRGLA